MIILWQVNLQPEIMQKFMVCWVLFVLGKRIDANCKKCNFSFAEEILLTRSRLS